MASVRSLTAASVLVAAAALARSPNAPLRQIRTSAFVSPTGGSAITSEAVIHDKSLETAAPRPAASRIGATNWAPCYYLRAGLPVLHDGAVAAAATGSRVLKIAAFNPESNFPYNSNWPSYGSLQELLGLPYYATLFSNAIPGYPTSFTDFVMVAYRVGPSDGNYWRDGITQGDINDEIAQFTAATSYLMSTYAGAGLTFTFEEWELDWASRGDYNASQPAAPSALSNLATWLNARQTGVTAGRQAFFEGVLDGSIRVAPRVAERIAQHVMEAGGLHRASVQTLLEAAGVAVYHSAEVNLVHNAMTDNQPNVVNAVLPNVALDMVSYSSYDTMSMNPGLSQAIDYILTHHVSTPATPAAPFFIAEYGTPFNEWPLSQIQQTVTNVVNATLSNDAVAYALWWETFNNESPNVACPNFDPSTQRGFWLFLPNGTTSWAFDYLQQVIANGTAAI